MRHYIPALALALAACGPGIYTRAEVVYAEPAQYEYVVPVDQVVVVTRDVLVRRGYVVYRVQDDGQRVLIRGVRELRDRGRHKGWVRQGRAEEVVGDIDVRLRAH